MGAVQANHVGLELPIAAMAAPTPREASVLLTVALSMFWANSDAAKRRANSVPAVFMAGVYSSFRICSMYWSASSSFISESFCSASLRSCLFVSFLERSISARALPWRNSAWMTASLRSMLLSLA